jgi:type I restriction enzyme S subunit
LDQVAEVRLGRQRAPKNHRGDHMRPYLRAANVGWSGLRLDDVKHMNFTDAELDTYRLQPGDLLLSEASGSPGEVGKPALWSGEIEDCAFQNTLLRVRARKHEPEFLLHYFRYMALSGRFVPEARGVGINHLGRSRLAGWMTPMPERHEQRRIVEVLEDHLSHLDAAYRGVASVSGRLRALRRSLAEQAVQSRPGLEAVPIAEATSGDRSDIVIGPFGSNLTRSDYRTSGTPLVFVRHVRSGEFGDTHYVDAGKARELSAHQVVDGDILMTKMGDPPGDTSVYYGPTAIITADVLRLRPSARHDPQFVALALAGRHAHQQILSITSGVAQKKVSLARFRSSVSVHLPPLPEQRERVTRFREQTEPLERQESMLAAAHQKIAALRRGVLTAAFEGNLTGRHTDVDVIEELAEA